jgi:hypothetical protein
MGANSSEFGVLFSRWGSRAIRWSGTVVFILYVCVWSTSLFYPWEARLFWTINGRYSQLSAIGWRGIVSYELRLDDQARSDFWRGRILPKGVYFAGLRGKYAAAQPVWLTILLGNAYIGDPLRAHGVPGGGVTLELSMGLTPHILLILFIARRLHLKWRSKMRDAHGFDVSRVSAEKIPIQKENHTQKPSA